jgi:small subunit ribosomal protein S17
MEKVQQKQKRVYVGEVIANTMQKTLVVKVARTFTHPRFHKIMRADKKYKVHNPVEVVRVGDIIEFYEGRPASKTKCMYFMRVVRTSNASTTDALIGL